MANSSSPVPQVVEGTGAVRKLNENFDAGSQALLGGRNAATSALLAWGFIGGRVNGVDTANGTVTLTASATNYLVWKKSDGVVSVSTSNTNWNDTTNYWRLYQITVGTTAPTSYTDERSSQYGLFGIATGAGSSGDVVGPASSVSGNIPTFNGTSGKLLQDSGESIATLRSVPQNSQSAAYTAVLADAGKHLLHPSADTTARIFTIPANSSVPYPIGTALTFVNQNGAGTITIAITTDTMRLAGAGTTGSRTLAANGIATALKITATEWIISGTGLS